MKASRESQAFGFIVSQWVFEPSGRPCSFRLKLNFLFLSNSTFENKRTLLHFFTTVWIVAKTADVNENGFFVKNMKTWKL